MLMVKNSAPQKVHHLQEIQALHSQFSPSGQKEALQANTGVYGFLSGSAFLEQEPLEHALIFGISSEEQRTPEMLTLHIKQVQR